MASPQSHVHDRTDGRTDHSNSDGRGRGADSPTDIPAKGWKDIGKRVMVEMKENHTQLLAAGVAFWAFTSIFPALIAAITIYGLVVDPEEVTRRVEDLAGALPEEARSLLGEQLSSIAAGSGSALGIGLIVSVATALWSASAAMSNLMEAINAVYEERDERNYIKKKGLALLLTLGAIAFLGLAIAGIGVVPTALDAVNVSGIARTLLSLAVWPILGAIFVAAMAILYRVAPNRDDARWTWLTPGAITAMVLWVIASFAFQFYTANFGSYNETYGALAAVVILLLWLMISALCVLLGAHINAEMEAQTEKDTTVDPERPRGQREAHKADEVGPSAEQMKTKDRKDGDDTDDPNDSNIDLREEHVR